MNCYEGSSLPQIFDSLYVTVTFLNPNFKDILETNLQQEDVPVEGNGVEITNASVEIGTRIIDIR